MKKQEICYICRKKTSTRNRESSGIEVGTSKPYKREAFNGHIKTVRVHYYQCTRCNHIWQSIF